LRLGQVESHKIHVFLPREYENNEERYPVVYINDGDTIFWAGWSLKSARVRKINIQQTRTGFGFAK